jgi:hypothetical protein
MRKAQSERPRRATKSIGYVVSDSNAKIISYGPGNLRTKVDVTVEPLFSGHYVSHCLLGMPQQELECGQYRDFLSGDFLLFFLK